MHRANPAIVIRRGHTLLVGTRVRQLRTHANAASIVTVWVPVCSR